MGKNLDDELADAILTSGREDAPPLVRAVPPGTPRAREPRTPQRSIGLLVTLLVMLGAIVSLFLVVFKPAAVYATPVDELVRGGSALVGRKVRVEGELVPGTLVKRTDPSCEYRFTIHKEAAKLPVSYSRCTIPDGFRDVPQGGVQVTLEGALSANGDFEATLVMAKCSSKYDPATHQMAGDAKTLAAPPID